MKSTSVWYLPARDRAHKLDCLHALVNDRLTTPRRPMAPGSGRMSDAHPFLRMSPANTVREAATARLLAGSPDPTPPVLRRSA
jgi:hypothetical protein